MPNKYIIKYLESKIWDNGKFDDDVYNIVSNGGLLKCRVRGCIW